MCGNQGIVTDLGHLSSRPPSSPSLTYSSLNSVLQQQLRLPHIIIMCGNQGIVTDLGHLSSRPPYLPLPDPLQPSSLNSVLQQQGGKGCTLALICDVCSRKPDSVVVIITYTLGRVWEAALRITHDGTLQSRGILLCKVLGGSSLAYRLYHTPCLLLFGSWVVYVMANRIISHLAVWFTERRVA